MNAVLKTYRGRRRVHRLLMEHALARGPGTRLVPLYKMLGDVLTSGARGMVTTAEAFVLTHAFAGDDALPTHQTGHIMPCATGRPGSVTGSGRLQVAGIISGRRPANEFRLDHRTPGHDDADNGCESSHRHQSVDNPAEALHTRPAVSIAGSPRLHWTGLVAVRSPVNNCLLRHLDRSCSSFFALGGSDSGPTGACRLYAHLLNSRSAERDQRWRKRRRCSHAADAVVARRDRW